MSALTNLIISAIVATWVMVIALVSVQNASLVSLKFLFWQSIDLPWGLVLGAMVSIGSIVGGCLPLLGNSSTINRNSPDRFMDSKSPTREGDRS